MLSSEFKDLAGKRSQYIVLHMLFLSMLGFVKYGSANVSLIKVVSAIFTHVRLMAAR